VSKGPALVDGIVSTGVVLEVVVVGTTVVKLAAVTRTVDVEADDDLLGDDEQPAIRHAPTMTSAVRVLDAIVVHPCPGQPRGRRRQQYAGAACRNRSTRSDI
jgi:hypothetical protein